MEHCHLFSHSYLMGLNGHVLSTEEKANLQSSLMLLKNESHCYRIVFWGKIFGLKNDYFIAQGYRESILGERLSYYSINNGVTWHQLSLDVKSEDVPYLKSIKAPFMGDPTHFYVFERAVELFPEKKEEPKRDEEKKDDKEEDEDEEDNDGEEEAEIELTEEEIAEKKRKELEATWYRTTEEARLKYFIQSADHDLSVVPRGAFVLNAAEHVVPNQTFAGLDRHASSKLINYVHTREPEKVPLKSILEKEHLSKSIDFMDTIAEDVPNRCWSLQYDDSYGVIVGRSLLWPGYVFYHIPNSSTWGSFYFGNGLKNTDLCFML